MARNDSLVPYPELRGIWRFVQVMLFIFPLLPSWGGVGLIVALVAIWKQQYRRIIQRPLNWGLAILSIGLIITCCFAAQPLDAFLGLANLLPFFALFAAFSVLIQTPAQLRRIAWLYVLASVPVVILGFGQIWGGWTSPEQLQVVLGWVLQANGNPPGRMASVFMYANILAAFLLMVLLLGLGLWVENYQAWRRHSRRHQGWVLLFLSVVLLGNGLALVLVDSRNAWAVAILGCLAFALYLGWHGLVAGVGVVVGSVLWASFGPPLGREWLREIVPYYFWGRLSDQMYPDRPLPMLRRTQWEFAWNLTQAHPWTGWGLRNFTALYEAQTGFWFGHPHNLPLMLTAETGIPATLLLLGLVGAVLARAVLLLGIWSAVAPTKGGVEWHQDKIMLFAYLVAFGGCTLFNLLDVTLFDPRVNTFGWLLLAALSGVTYRYRALLLWRTFKRRQKGRRDHECLTGTGK